MRCPMLAVVTLAAPAFAQTAAFFPLGDLSGGTAACRALTVSADGMCAVGLGNNGADIGARWVSSGGGWSMPAALPPLAGGSGATARTAANGGLVLFGESQDSGGFRQAVRWIVPAGGGAAAVAMLGYPPAGGYSGAAYACSADGSVVCGENLYAPPPKGGPPPLPITQAFRWTASGGTVDLGTLPGTSPSPGGTHTARAISRDGSVIAGYGIDGSNTYRPWRWTAQTGMVDLSAAGWSGFARGVSPDGAFVVGNRTVGSTSEAFAWSAGAGREDPGTIGTFEGVTYTFSAALDASGGADRLCGINQVAGASNTQLATIWDRGRGWRSVKRALADAGVNMTGWTLSFANSMSDDGTVIAGYGTNPAGQTQAWVAIIPTTCVADFDDGSGTGRPDGGVTIDDLLFYLAIFNQGDVRADVDNGSGTGTPDGGVTIDDLLYYLARFNTGC